MLFALICTDRPNSLELRTKVRPQHLAYLNSIKTKAAGPFVDDAGHATGSLVVIEAADMAGAKALAADDPYAKAGLFASVDIRPWKWLVNNPEAQ